MAALGTVVPSSANVRKGSLADSAFSGDAPEKGCLRFCFAKEDATLDAVIGRLARFRRS